MFREESFGTMPMRPMEMPGCTGPSCFQSFDPPRDTQGAYDPYSPQSDAAVIDNLIAEPLHPAPTRMANATDVNPWEAAIEQTLTGELLPLADGMLTSYAEGRPPGEFYAHQRWDEFYLCFGR